MRQQLDPISLQIMWTRLISIANRGAATLLRTAFSTVVGSAEDYKYMVTDSRGDALALSDGGSPEFVVTFPKSLRAMLDVFPLDTLSPGDVLVTNDPWLCAGHANDVHLATPVFRRGRVVAFSGSVIHLADIGGRYGAYDAKECFEEGLCLPPLKLFRNGEPVSEVFRILEANVRVPEMQIGDIHAMVAANEVGVQLLNQFMDEYDLDDLDDLSTTVQSKVEDVMRNAIEALPDGSYEHETRVDGYDIDVRIRSRTTISGSNVTVDFAGTSPQTSRAAVNVVLNMTEAQVPVPFKALLAPHIPWNEGTRRPIRVVAPVGSILNAVRPAAVFSRAMISVLLIDHILGSLAQVLPERVLAESGTRWMLMCDRSPMNGRRVQAGFWQAGAMGAAHDRDGPNAKFFPIMAAHTPVEVFERIMGLTIKAKTIRPDSGGPGTYRGGCSQLIELTNPGETRVDFQVWNPRVRFPASGLFGGHGGAPGMAIKGREPITDGRFSLEPGDEVALYTPGGGGYGDPMAREPSRVLDDVLDGYVSIGRARSDYGVAIRDGQVLSSKTRALRERGRGWGKTP